MHLKCEHQVCPVTFFTCWERYLKWKHSCCWLQVYSIVEIKIDVTNALVQLLAYISWILIECINWLFLIVFTLNDWLLQMHPFDYSGIVCFNPINIHNVSSRTLSIVRQEWWCVPRNLCFPLLPLPATLPWYWLEQLGWDPSIEVWDGDYVVPSYRARIQQYASTYHVPWVISTFSSFQISES